MSSGLPFRSKEHVSVASFDGSHRTVHQEKCIYIMQNPQKICILQATENRFSVKSTLYFFSSALLRTIFFHFTHHLKAIMGTEMRDTEDDIGVKGPQQIEFAEEDVKKPQAKVDYSGAQAKTDPKEIALVKKLDRWIMVSPLSRVKSIPN